MRATSYRVTVGAIEVEIERRSILRRLNEAPPQAEALDRIKEWTRERFALAQDTTILVSEIACGLPGCPPRETVVAFWTQRDKRHQFRIFKPPERVAEDDLPPSWLKNALIALDGFECC
jgi:nitrate reductase delta subunit